MNELVGTVQSHTVIRVPGNVHAEAAPFVLLLVELDDGKRVLGHFSGSEPPAIDTCVKANQSEGTPVFSIAEETS
jgi:uncharacterized OB-fold protein